MKVIGNHNFGISNLILLLIPITKNARYKIQNQSKYPKF